MMMRLRSRPLAIVALILIALVSVETAAALAHAHASLDGCAPCRLLVVSGGVELPAAATLAAPSVAERDRGSAQAAEIVRPASPAVGRAPPAVV